MRRGFPESNIVAQLGSILREMCDTWGITKEAMAGLVPESCLNWSIETGSGQAPIPPETDMSVAHDGVTTDSRKARQKSGKLVN